ncbi:hypothetical protein PR048_006249 [Dryococelus australis]|uniref:Copia protein n=1 Tax=Dryococelus australis TaxID=614101 RepID=A0ABQ9IBK8_9NEOP|nr:hypothetical protein PR048_006249 [Dryococelus australis]
MSNSRDKSFTVNYESRFQDFAIDRHYLFCALKYLNSTLALSSAEAEYIALYETIREIMWVEGLLLELGIDIKGASVYDDSKCCTSIASSPTISKRTKYMDVKLHFVKEKVNDGTLKLLWVYSTEQTADTFTKVLETNMFFNSRRNLFLHYIHLEWGGGGRSLR